MAEPNHHSGHALRSERSLQEDQRTRRSAIMATAARLVLILIAVMVFLKYKENNEEAIRPLYQASLVGLLAYLAIAYAAVAKKHQLHFEILYLLYNRLVWLFLCVLLYMFVMSVFSGDRQFKDYIYFATATWLTGAIVVVMLVGLGHVETLAEEFSAVIITVACLSGIVAVGVMAGWFRLEVGDYLLEQNKWSAGRLHGFLGEPTAFGSLIGLAIVSAQYLWLRRGGWPGLVLIAALAGLLAWSGSRNGILSSITAIAVMSGLVRSWSKLIICVVAIVFSVIFVEVAFFNVGDTTNIQDVSTQETRHVEPIQRSPLAREDMSLSSSDNRLVIWRNVIEMYSRLSIREKLLGAGAGALRDTYRSGFNVFLEMLYDYGLIATTMFAVGLVALITGAAMRAHSSGQLMQAFTAALAVYMFTFSQFVSTVPDPFLNFPTIGLVLSVVLYARVSVRHALRVESGKLPTRRESHRSASERS